MYKKIFIYVFIFGMVFLYVDFLNKKIGGGRNKFSKLINKLIGENYFKVKRGEKNTQYLILNEL